MTNRSTDRLPVSAWVLAIVVTIATKFLLRYLYPGMPWYISTLLSLVILNVVLGVAWLVLRRK
ncbi:hypothetical protein GCM10022243_46190 [Saccharothrix violaceirubra]|uniref:Uncharacterized protein n=1 Tax=Saccharothrix violaceirubra TaxID=413306 RepID=A0A7W7T0U2_9PSEU|nr:hypothetical protein [Saccharothrix violaceirubra]MBB4964491.1 hypothetical protein [Saccharothrix violaceirubra]